MKRYLATFYRHKWLYLAILLLMIAASGVGTYYLSRAQYEASARIWVDKPVLGHVLNQDTPNYGVPPSPAQQQADKLHQLLQTDSFVTAIIKTTGAADELTGVPDHDEQIIAKVRKKLAVGVLGSNTVSITFWGKDPVLCQQMVQGTIDEFRNWNLQSQIDQSSVELQFYRKQVEIYQEHVNEIIRAIDDFYTKYPHPEPGSPQHLELQRLQRELETARGLYAAANTKIAQASVVDTLSENSRGSEFQILDAPTVPQLPSATLNKLMTYFALGLGAGFGLVLTAVVLATWLDTAIRSTDDLKRFGGVPVLAVIPHLKSSRQRSRRGDPDPLPDPRLRLEGA